MRKMLMGLAILSVLAFAGRSEAASGTVSMNWDNCTGPVDKTSAGALTYPLTVSVLGIDFLHKAYDVKILYGNASQTVPDAWRFDAVSAACQGSAQAPIIVNWGKAPPASASGCGAAMMQTSTPSLVIPDISLNGATSTAGAYGDNLMRITLANSYPNGVTAISAATRYFLMSIAFNHQFSVDGVSDPGLTCGGLVQPICFKLQNAGVLDLTGAESQMDRPSGVVSVSFNGASACSAVPAKAKTWGQIKSQYRN